MICMFARSVRGVVSTRAASTYRYVNLSEHVDSLPSVYQSDILWCGHDDRAYTRVEGQRSRRT